MLPHYAVGWEESIFMRWIGAVITLCVRRFPTLNHHQRNIRRDTADNSGHHAHQLCRAGVKSDQFPFRDRLGIYAFAA